MAPKNNTIIILRTILILIFIVAVIFFGGVYFSKKHPLKNLNVLGAVAGIFASPTPLPPTPTNTPVPTPTPVDPTVLFIHSPGSLTEGEIATFTWLVTGPVTTVTTSAVFFGTGSTPGILANTMVPDATTYTDKTKEFLNDAFAVPIQFVGNIKIDTAGTYYARAYILYKGKHIWSDEQSFQVKKKPLNEIKLVNQPTKITHGENTSFTWDILGPVNKTNYTVIVGGKVSKSGSLDEKTDISGTPYNTIFVKDFTSNSIDIPFRFVGNTTFTDTGTYYYRAFASINGKYIWSDEYTLEVE